MIQIVKYIKLLVFKNEIYSKIVCCKIKKLI